MSLVRRGGACNAGVTGHFVLDAPATPERIRMACSDLIVPNERAAYRAKLSC